MMTKEEFIKIYNENKPNFLVRFIYKYFGGKLNKKPYPYGAWVSLLCFFIATIGMIYGDQIGNKELANKFVTVYLGFVAMFPITLYAFLTNQKRTKNIANKMGLSIEDYNKYCDMYL